jgi:hypothetical protein
MEAAFLNHTSILPKDAGAKTISTMEIIKERNGSQRQKPFEGITTRSIIF